MQNAELIINLQIYLIGFTRQILFFSYNPFLNSAFCIINSALYFGGLKWTRTTDLALIRRTL